MQPILPSLKRAKRTTDGAVEVGDAVHHANLVVLVEDALVLAAHHVVADEADQVGLAHGHATDAVEDEVVVNQFSNGFAFSLLQASM